MAFLQIAGLPGDVPEVTDGPGKVLHIVEDILDDLEEVPGFVREVLGFVEKFPGFVRDLMDNMGEVPGFVREIMGVVEYLPGFGRDLFRLTGDILFFAGDIRNFVRKSLRISFGIAIGRRQGGMVASASIQQRVLAEKIELQPKARRCASGRR